MKTNNIYIDYWKLYRELLISIHKQFACNVIRHMRWF